jgi:hypothetical protein
VKYMKRWQTKIDFYMSLIHPKILSDNLNGFLIFYILYI